jgi:hypothetical protein
LYQQTAAWHLAQLFLCVIHTQPAESDRMELNSEGIHVLDTETHHNVDLYCRCYSSNVPRRNLIPHYCTLRYKSLLSLEPHFSRCKYIIFFMRTMKAYSGMEVYRHSLLSTAVNGELVYLRPGQLTARESTVGTIGTM